MTKDKLIKIIKKKIKYCIFTFREHTIPKSKLKYYCPCCDFRLTNFKRFYTKKSIPVSDIHRYLVIKDKVICPNCRSLPRHRILVNYFRHHRSIIDGDKNILYFAVEDGIKQWLNRKSIAFTSADLFDEDAMLKIDIEDTKLPDNSYDLIVCNHVLEHVNDYHRALNELHRILKPTGVLIISFPIDETFDTVYEDSSITDPQDRKRHFGQVDHLRIFGKDSADILNQHGFSTSIISGDSCPKSHLPIVGPANYDVNYLFECRIKPTN